MVTKRVTAHYMHEEELQAALAVLGHPQVQGRVIVGEVDDTRLAELRDTGVFVTVVDEDPQVPGPARGRRGEPGLSSGGGRRGARPSPIPVAPAVPADLDVWVLRLAGPLLDPWRQSLEHAGVELIERLRPDSYSAWVRLSAVPAVRSLGFVVEMGLYETPETVARTTLSQRRGGRATVPPRPFEVLVHRTDDLDDVRTWLDARNLTVQGGARRKLRFLARPDAAALTELARLPSVATVEEFVPPRLSNDHARRILGLDPAGPGGSAPIGLTGQGQMVAVADSGIDDTHPDLRKRLVDVRAWGRPDDASDDHGHGTHVAGSVVGDGTASAGAVRGTAPEAGLFFQSIMDGQGGLGGLPADLAELFDEAYQAGARIHNNSWGAEAGSAYRVSSLEVDDFVASHPDMLLVIAAGNDGTAAQPRFTNPGSVDLFSLDAPATAKNALTVGASRSDRVVPGAPTWAQWWDANFPPPLGDEAISGDPEAMAAFSGRGPCDEQIRAKPDIVAPGTFILSTRSAIAPAENFWAEGDPGYAYMGGTSMAAPLVSGSAALVRQYFTETRDHEPSAALLKAALVNGARWLSGRDALHDHAREPNYHQGFGRLYLPWTIPNPLEPAMRLEYVDDWQDRSTGFSGVGDARRYVVTATEDTWLRLCLVWTDPPGRGLQNNLALLAEHRESGTKWVGNQNRPAQFPSPDPGNNVQVIRLDRPDAGTYLIQVVASNILHGPQSFALVVAGGLNSALTVI
ncbi:subtilase family protein [Geodermatophilus normandii]|uniref:Subtilase family protein n=1 Tax=Geodermatophilus normandii TaxID=1137989 RepID=A0A317QQS5_9ACTN|nr:S8 family serine peptidase [Geodermatophilus normandii]PWW25191.1 subtilase family protein [Geodermatophilus normandii]